MKPVYLTVVTVQPDAAVVGQQIAQEDLWWWNLDIAERLPAGAIGAVDIAPGDGTDRYTVSVTWSEAGFATPQSYAVTFDR